MAELKTVLKHYAQSEVELTDKTELVGDLGIDSLGVMEVVADLESKFELAIEDEDLQAVQTVGDVVRALEARLRQLGRFAD
ncbi:MAG: hypothetical protein HY744_13795 [Deltaproteobacteria bacterium]|nr:hypothetical protein [Deltaproteobacteria bacterium]